MKTIIQNPSHETSTISAGKKGKMYNLRLDSKIVKVYQIYLCAFSMEREM
mgnify:FL=1